MAALVDVTQVSVGPTRCAAHRTLEHGGACTITGPWTPHPGPWDALKPKARQVTFATIRDDVMKLHRWNDPARKWEPVTLLDEYRPTALERLLSEGEQHVEKAPPKQHAEDG